MLRKKKELLILLLLVSIFCVSVGVRYKHFGQPLARHHEWLSAHTLVILKNWDQRGIADCRFANIYTFKNGYDKMDYTVCSLMDDRGDMYYVSYGPFASMFAYAFMKLFFLPVNHNSLVAFGLITHFFTSLFLYLLVLKTEKKTFSAFSIGALCAFTVYLFSPGTLWFHSNVYFSETVIQFFIAAALYAFACVHEVQGAKWKYNIWLGVICFFAIYTEWMGLFVAFLMGVYFFIRMLWNKTWFRPFIAVFAAGVCACGLILLHYSSIAGYDKLTEAWTAKFIDRNGGSILDEITTERFAVTNENVFVNIEWNLNDNFVNVINMLAFVVPVFALVVLVRRKYIFTWTQLAILFILAAAVFLHHFVFFNFTALHDFAMLKTGLLLIVALSFMVARIEKFASDQKMGYAVFAGLMCVFIAVKSKNAYDKYDHVNRLDYLNPTFKIVGELIHEHAHNEEKIFSNYAFPMVTCYAERNVFWDPDGKSVRSLSVKQQIPMLYVWSDGRGNQRVVHYKPSGDSLSMDFHIRK